MSFISNILSKNVVGAVAAGAMMVFGATGAMAATCDVGACVVAHGVDGQNLTDGVSFGIDDITNDAVTGNFNFVATFFNNTSDDAIAATTVLQFQQTVLASINDLFLTVFFPAAAAQSFRITNADGTAHNPTGNDVVVRLDLSAAPNQLIGFEFQGVAVKGGINNNLNPGIQMSISAVPLPAGGLLLLTALGGMAVMRRRRKAA